MDFEQMAVTPFEFGPCGTASFNFGQLQVASFQLW